MKRVVEAGVTRQSEEAYDPWFSEQVIAWQRTHGRNTLPWQNTRDAYRIWLSEIMLQQTQVSAVIPYYLRFLDRFPTVLSLADAPVEAVMELWSGLGYYTRARNLHRCAQTVRDTYQGVFPSDPALLEELPGIGRSTAAAIAAFSAGARAAILDGNVKRVFSRMFGIEGYPGTREIENAMWQRAQALLPEQGIEAYTQGLMDLGATLCTRGKPDCSQCPLQTRCVALKQGRTHELPETKPRKASPTRAACLLMVSDGQSVCLEQRPPTGIWGGLLSLPEVSLAEPDMDTQTILANVQARLPALGLKSAKLQSLPMLMHVFTHFRLQIYPYRIDISKRPHKVADAQEVWLSFEELASAALPAPVKKLLLAEFARS